VQIVLQSSLDARHFLPQTFFLAALFGDFPGVSLLFSGNFLETLEEVAAIVAQP